METFKTHITGQFNATVSSITPFAKKTTHYLRTKIGSRVEELSLPEDYVELEQQVDSLKEAYNLVLPIVETVEVDGYDYPTNFRDSITDFGKTVSGKVRNLGNLTPLEQTPLASVGKNLEEKEEAAKPSRTLYNAISRAASEATTKMGAGNPLSSAFGQISVLEEKVGNLQGERDSAISKNFCEQVRAVLYPRFAEAHRVKADVQDKRLQLEMAKLDVESAKPENLEHCKSAVRSAEDELNGAIEHAKILYEQILNKDYNTDLLRSIIKNQLKFHQDAAAALSDITI
ncbi:Protein GVP36 [Schizosaccharomyces pombe]